MMTEKKIREKIVRLKEEIDAKVAEYNRKIKELESLLRLQINKENVSYSFTLNEDSLVCEKWSQEKEAHFMIDRDTLDKLFTWLTELKALKAVERSQIVGKQERPRRVRKQETLDWIKADNFEYAIDGDVLRFRYLKDGKKVWSKNLDLKGVKELYDSLPAGEEIDVNKILEVAIRFGINFYNNRSAARKLMKFYSNEFGATAKYVASSKGRKLVIVKPVEPVKPAKETKEKSAETVEDHPPWIDCGDFKYCVANNKLKIVDSNGKVEFDFDKIRAIYNDLPKTATVDVIVRVANRHGVKIDYTTALNLIKIYTRYVEFDAELRIEYGQLKMKKRKNDQSVADEVKKKLSQEKEVIGTPWG